ncbi:TadE/TadG family type IV pilus assembly protein [Pontibacterium sp.]
MKPIFESQKMPKRQRGLAAVEFTIAAPILLMLFIGTAELGKLLYDYNTLSKAQRNGIRYLAAQASPGQTEAAIDNTTFIDNATNLVVYGNLAGTGDPLLEGFSTDDVTFDDPTVDDVRVTVTYDYSPMIFNAVPSFGFGTPTALNFTLSSSITMRALL